VHCTKATQTSFGQVLTELPADELLVLTDDVFCSFTTTTTAGYERGSTLVTSNLPFQELTEVLGSEWLTGALDRLTHHLHILEMNGESYRIKQSKHKRNPQPGR
jgi:hypothetical protein